MISTLTYPFLICRLVIHNPPTKIMTHLSNSVSSYCDSIIIRPPLFPRIHTATATIYTNSPRTSLSFIQIHTNIQRSQTRTYTILCPKHKQQAQAHNYNSPLSISKIQTMKIVRYEDVFALVSKRVSSGWTSNFSKGLGGNAKIVAMYYSYVKSHGGIES